VPDIATLNAQGVWLGGYSPKTPLAREEARRLD
jgi:hypothetical protein